jgi:arylsulfatase
VTHRAAHTDGPPNILLVVIDDAGFGNLCTFGGPSRTRTAESGLRYSRFTVRSAP